MVDRAIVTDQRGFADHDTHAVVDEEAPADRGARMDFYAGQPAADVGQEARQPFEIPTPQPVRKPVKQQCVKPGIAGDDLPARARSRIAVEYDAYLFPDSVQHKNPFI